MLQTQRKRKRRHHIVPRFYLRGWADNRGRVLVVSRRDPSDRRLVRVEQAAVQTDFYTVEDASGERHDDVEEGLSRIEERAAEIIRRLRSLSPFGHILDPESRQDLALFMALQKLRGRDFRHSYQAMADATMKIWAAHLTPENIRAILEEEGEEPTDDDVAEHLRSIQDFEDYRVEPHPNESIRTMLTVGMNMAQVLFASKSWHVLKLPEPCLVTSDAPMTLWARQRPRWGGIGILTADEVRFPINPSTLLVMLPGLDKDGVGFLPRSAGDDANRLTVASSYEWVFVHPSLEPVLDAIEQWGDPPPVMSIQSDAGANLPESVRRPPYRGGR